MVSALDMLRRKAKEEPLDREVYEERLAIALEGGADPETARKVAREAARVKTDRVGASRSDAPDRTKGTGRP